MKKNKAIKLIITITLFFIILLPNYSFAATSNSTGSAASDIEGTNIIGKDTEQNKQSEYDEYKIYRDKSTNVDTYVYMNSSESYTKVLPKEELDEKDKEKNKDDYKQKLDKFKNKIIQTGSLYGYDIYLIFNVTCLLLFIFISSKNDNKKNKYLYKLLN